VLTAGVVAAKKAALAAALDVIPETIPVEDSEEVSD
jgi:hypothetical protein